MSSKTTKNVEIFFCLLFRRYLPKNNQRRREKTPTSLLISQEPTFWPCVKTERTSEVSESRQDEESCNRYTHTHNCRTQTHIHSHIQKPTNNKNQNQQCSFFYISLLPKLVMKKTKTTKRRRAADRRVKKENTEKNRILVN